MVATPSRQFAGNDAFRDVLEENFRQRNLVHLAAGSQVPLLRHSIWLVVRGMVKLGSLTIHGDDLILGLAGPNEPFGEPLTDVEAFEARTLCDTDLLCLSLDEVRSQPPLAQAMLEAVLRRYRQSQSLLALMGLRRVEERVRGFLELLALDYGHFCDNGLRLDLRLTHQEMASALGTTRVTVTRVIGQLRQEGWLRFDSQKRLVISHLPQR
jgi:CRP-like cAMP-binding protein